VIEMVDELASPRGGRRITTVTKEQHARVRIGGVAQPEAQV